MTCLSDITERYRQIQYRIEQACLQQQKASDTVRLLAVSKTKPAPQIRTLYDLGQRDFGENYLQDAQPKVAELTDCDIQWHYIGQLQSNKTRTVAELFHWVHSVDRLKIAQRLNDQTDRLLNICLQVNIDAEPQKAGVTPDAVIDLAQAVHCLPNLQLRGLMIIPASGTKPDIAFQRAQALFQLLQHTIDQHEIDTLSMGMSADLETAIRYGSTCVRIGTALFGARDK